MEARSTSRPATANATATAADAGTTSTASASQATAADTTAETAAVPAEQQQQHQPKSKGYGIVRFATIEAAQASHSLLTISSIALAANSSAGLTLKGSELGGRRIEVRQDRHATV
eukprot:19068-Heterococcus_DN1.PRE.4